VKIDDASRRRGRRDLAGAMAKNKSAKTMLGIKKMMAGGARAAQPVQPVQPAQKRTRPAGEPSAARGEQAGLGAAGHGTESGDVLDDNFMLEAIAPGDEDPDVLDGGSGAEDSDGEDARRAAAGKKRKHEELKARKKALQAPRREDSAAIASAGAGDKAAFFLVRSPVASAARMRGARR
jgi:hypothetical protein